MKRERPGLERIKAWINESQKSHVSAPEIKANPVSGANATVEAGEVRVPANKLSLAEVNTVANEFLKVLNSYNPPNESASDWTVKIALVDVLIDVYVVCESGGICIELIADPSPTGLAFDHQLSMHSHELKALTDFETDLISVMISNIGIAKDKNEKPMELIRPISDILFGAYNMHFLKDRFSDKLVHRLYEEGKVANFTGSERFIFPWAISSDIGTKLYDIIAENNIERSLEVGLAFGLSALFICEAHDKKGSGHHTAIDPCQSVEFESIGLAQIESANLNQYFRHLEFKDYEIFPKILEAREHYQFIFIDGLHMQDYVTLDFFYSDMLLDVGGFMAFDDCHAPGVSSAVAYFENNRQYRFVPEYSVLRFRVYQKLADDNRTIVSPNHHVDYSEKYYQLSGIKQPAALRQVEPNAVQPSVISVVGIDGLFPNDLTVEGYWSAIEKQTVLYDDYAADFLLTRSESDQPKNLSGGMLKTAYDFDPLFFNISVAEAEIMDPQLRHMLMSVQRAIEDAGHTTSSLSDKTVGVYIGAEGSDYNDVHRSESFARNYILHQSGPSLANRISHHFDFQGPSEVINTMCSSGAVGVAHAVEALRSGDIDYAIVGAVKINFVSSIYGALEELNITSRSGKCYSFHQDSDGYVRSEGVVSLILTRQHIAEEQNDHVYANIRAVATNYNGRDGHSMFSPSKNAQKELLKKCITESGIAVTDVTSFEAQGMGNNISDLVEYSVFTDAHEEMSQAEINHHQMDALPAITTVKPILGHMECVSSLAAMLKAMLSFKNRTLYGIPSLTKDTIHRNLMAHQGAGLLLGHTPVEPQTKMIIGLNSFGASGTNVHMILEQPDRTAPEQPEHPEMTRVLLMSGKTIEALQKNIRYLCSRLETDAEQFPIVEYLATMQLHRDHHEHKVAIVLEKGSPSSQRVKLHDRLKTYLRAQVSDQLIRDNIPQGLYHFEAAPIDGSNVAASMMDQADQWLQGKQVDWRSLYPTGLPAKPGRLPGYQFDTQRYHLTPGQRTEHVGGDRIDSLLSQNISDFSLQAYLSKFTGHEPFLVDHQVDNQKVLPAVVYLEMVRAAIQAALPEKQAENRLELNDVVWPQPCFVADQHALKTALLPTRSQTHDGISVKFEISSHEATGPRIHCQGSAWIGSAESTTHIDLDEIQARMQKAQYSSEDLYDRFAEMGVSYGRTHRCLGALKCNDHEVLAYLQQPANQTSKEIIINPGLLDSALQSTLLLVLNEPNVHDVASLPFAVEQVVINGTPGPTMLAWTRLANGSRLDDEVVKFNIDVCDHEGRVIIGLKHFSVRSLAPVQATTRHLPAPTAASSGAQESAQAINFIKHILAEHLKIPVAQVDINKSFIEHGLDSILITQFTARLRKHFSNITSTLFFEVQNIRGLVNHLATHNAAELQAITGQANEPKRTEDAMVSQQVESPDTPSMMRQGGDIRFAFSRQTSDRALVHEDIAIVGLSGRYPNAADVNAFWENLRDGINCISEVPSDRWDWRKNHNPERGRKDSIYTRWGGFLDDVDKFDPLFFKLSPAEAERIDPQERIFLEAAYHAIEDAGHTPKTLSATQKVGVFVGVMNSMYNVEPDHFSIANRTSYLFDFHGPSMSVDTACSSSLTAIHLAVESIKSGQSEAAIAGGVNLILDDHHYQRLSAMSALSSGNACKAFGANADGFIDAEGVGAVVLKTLHQAEADGDHIYGVIKGTALNAGGKTAGYTVPCPRAQAALIKDVLHHSQIKADQISYIETHGTGTELGDPIEIAGLSQAFSTLSDQDHKIAIGSVKSNIGHCESAAGIAGVTKILLQLKHNMLAPSLHAEKPNAEIDFTSTPFQVQHQLSPWKSTAESVSKSRLRTAGVSSFGLGGANAHVIIQEHRSPIQEMANDPIIQDQIIVLSARTAEQLKTKAMDLLTFLESNDDIKLSSLSYTLQVGREHMDHRLGLVAKDVVEVCESLRHHVSGENDKTTVILGHVEEAGELLSLFGSDDDLQYAVKRWMAGGQWSRLVSLWVKGLTLNWADLYEDRHVQRMSLPGYPFARERHWAAQKAKAEVHMVNSKALHPLVQQNRSNLFQLAYQSQFTGHEFYLFGHQINDQKVLPAAAYLEMIHFAVADANGVSQHDLKLKISDLVWESACVPTADHTVTVKLFPADNQGLDFEVVSTCQSEQEQVHCVGHAVSMVDCEAKTIDIDELKQQINARQISGDEIYAGFADMGVQLSGANRGIRTIHKGKDQVLAELDLNHVQGGEEHNRFWLHPGIMDSALQSMIGMMTDLSETSWRSPTIPFWVNDTQITGATESLMYCWVRYAQGPDQPHLFDLVVCDQDGRVCVELKEFMVQEIPGKESPQADHQTMLATQQWIAPETHDDMEKTNLQPLLTDLRKVLLVGLPKVDCALVDAAIENSECQRLKRASDQLYTQVVVQTLGHLKNLLNEVEGESVFLQIAVANSDPYQVLAGLQGLLRTAETENPQLTTQLVFVDSDSEAADVIKALEVGRNSLAHGLIEVIGDQTRSPFWQTVKPAVNEQNQVFHDHGTYLITGGLGGLGQLFAEEVLKHTNQANVVITGRQATAEIPGSLVGHGDRINYRQLKLASLAETKLVLQKIEQQLGPIKGIFHSAGMVKDSFIIKHNTTQVKDVLHPKVAGVHHLDEASAACDLDFFVMFSSLAAVFGNAGQADYAAANGHLDQYARIRQDRVKLGERQGKTLSINWPYWQSGGMRLSDQQESLLLQNAGIASMPVGDGMKAFYQGLQMQGHQILVMHGDVNLMTQSLASVNRRQLAMPVTLNQGACEVHVDEKAVTAFFIQVLSDVLKLPAHQIKAKASFETYGMDSILAMDLTNTLQKTFGPLPKTLFFEHQNTRDLVAYFIEKYPDKLDQITAEKETKVAAMVVPPTRSKRSLQLRETMLTQPKRAAGKNHDIAVIGMSGQYPMADDINTFWENLKEGKDCVTEIPASRWDASSHFDPRKNTPGKSYSKWGGFLDGVDLFDPLFFNISPKEASLMDPQERLFLQNAWCAVEDAGYDKDKFQQQTVGVYVGVMWGHYELFGHDTALAGQPVAPSSSFGSIANRVSYFFDLNGPSMALDTMCSSSLTAIHLACEDIRHGHIDAAIAGGVNASLHPQKYLVLSQGNFAATDGKCRSFGEGGDGYVPGEGVGVVILKSLVQAEQDNDQIHGVIKATSINHGGKTHGYTVPNPTQQSALITRALHKANIDPATIGYVETHGTGTALGDPIEVAGLNKVFADHIKKPQSCPIGSVKSNIGHLESAAGVAAITKSLLQLKHRQLVPSLHAATTNPNIDFESSPFYVQTTHSDWPVTDGRPRRIGVSSFGAGGANGHVVLEEYIQPPRDQFGFKQADVQVFVLSAKNPQALLNYAEKMQAYLAKADDESFADIIYTAQVGRTAMEVRLALLVKDRADLCTQLSQWVAVKKSGDQASQATWFERNLKEQGESTSELLEGEAGEAYLDVVIKTEDFRKLAKLWTAGAMVNWSRLYQAQRPWKVSLPTYPFDQERTWLPIGLPQAVESTATIEQVTEKTRPFTGLCFTAGWEPAPTIQGDAGEDDTPTVLISTKPMPSVDENRMLHQVIAADGFVQLSSNKWSINTMDGNDFERLFDAIYQADTQAIKIIYVMNDAVTHDALQAYPDSAAADEVFLVLLNLCQALSKRKGHVPIQMVCAYLESANMPSAMGAAMGAFLKTAAMENPLLQAKTIALSSAQAHQNEADWMPVCFTELLHMSMAVEEIRHLITATNQASTTQRFRRVLSDTGMASIEQSDSVFKQGGNYLITGGLGALGYLVAAYLVQTYQANLILLGRSEPGNRQKQQLQDLKAHGSKVMYRQVDVCDVAAFKAMIASSQDEFEGGLNGVINSAGAIQDAYLIHKEPAQAQQVMQSKLAGIINSDIATANLQLDLFVVFSSLAGELGNVGQCDYAFANRFADVFVQNRQALVAQGQRQGRSVSIAWPYWRDGGMQISPDRQAEIQSATGLAPLPTTTGLALMEGILNSGFDYALPVYGDAQQLRSTLMQAGSAAADSDVQHLTEDMDSAALQLSTEGYLQQLIGEEINLEPNRVDVSEHFEHYGIDSVMIGKLNANLEKDLGGLPKTLFFDNLNIAELTETLIDLVPDKLMNKFAIRDKQATDRQPVDHKQREGAVLKPLANDGLLIGAGQDDHISAQQDATQAIAVIGMHGRYPGSDDLDAFWENIKSGRHLIEQVPDNRWNHEQWFDANPAMAEEGKIYCQWGGFLADVDLFEHGFFNISHHEAKLMDPQERLFLMSAWSAIEDAGYTKDELMKVAPKGKSADVGVFVGVTTNTYNLLAHEAWEKGDLLTPSAMPWSIANRTSYVLNLNGPSMPVDTACSSSLVAVNLACDSLRRGECQMALAGGVNLYLHPAKYLSMCQKRMLSQDGKCRSFGAGDNGFVPAEGVGSLLLKPLSKAEEDGDHIHSLILGGAHDHSGRSNGYSTPNPVSQARVIAQALVAAGSAPESIDYVEGHGTGTQLGDGLEVAALAQVLNGNGQVRQRMLGSVKSNMGHAESAAGIAGITKVILQMQHQQVAPSLHSTELNPDIDFTAAGFTVQQNLINWPAAEHKRRALVNSFGAGGVNACVVLEAYRSIRPQQYDQLSDNVFVLSAGSATQLQKYAVLIKTFLTNHPETCLHALCLTSQVGREAMQHRLAIQSNSVADLSEKLSLWIGNSGAEYAQLATSVTSHKASNQRIDESLRQQLHDLATERQWSKLMDAWLAGLPIDWRAIYGDALPPKIAMPTYPFKGERCWIIDESKSPVSQFSLKQPVETPGLHPLVTENTSTLSDISFVTRLSSTAYYATDHQVNGSCVFPGAAYLEMACVAGNLAGQRKVVKLKDIIWSHPLRFLGTDTELQTFMRAAGDNTEFRIVSQTDGYETQLHAEGKMVFGHTVLHAQNETHDLKKLQEACDHMVDGQSFYEQFSKIGFTYKKSFQSVQQVYVGAGFCLGQLTLPKHLEPGCEKYLMHPALLDGVLQTVSAIIPTDEIDEVFVPFAVDEIEMIRPLTKTCYVHVSYLQDGNARSSKFNRYQLVVLSESGQVLMKIKNFYLRAMTLDQKTTDGKTSVKKSVLSGQEK